MQANTMLLFVTIIWTLVLVGAPPPVPAMYPELA
jgi:hypothetical protein